MTVVEPQIAIDMLVLLMRASDVLDDFADVTDGAEGQPQANPAMGLKQDIDALLARVAP